MLAYLVIREGTKWTDVFRLVPGRTVTIGRAATNQIVIKDERASRNHAEIFLTRGDWTLRDLDSRNGTFVGERQVRGDYTLAPGDVVRIAQCQLAFVQDLSQAFPDPVTGAAGLAQLPIGEETTAGALVADTGEIERFRRARRGRTSRTTITHRRGQTRFLVPGGPTDVPVPRLGQAAAKLCRLAFELASQPDVPAVAHLALNGLFESTHVDAGRGAAVAARGTMATSTPATWRSSPRGPIVEPTYHRPSTFLAGNGAARRRGGAGPQCRRATASSAAATARARSTPPA